MEKLEKELMFTLTEDLHGHLTVAMLLSDGELTHSFWDYTPDHTRCTLNRFPTSHQNPLRGAKMHFQSYKVLIVDFSHPYYHAAVTSPMHDE